MDYNVHPAAAMEYLSAIRYMTEKFYDPRTIAKFVQEIDAVLFNLRKLALASRPDARGYYPQLLCVGPLEPLGYRVYFLPDVEGLPYVMVIACPKRKPHYAIHRKARI